MNFKYLYSLRFSLFSWMILSRLLYIMGRRFPYTMYLFDHHRLSFRNFMGYVSKISNVLDGRNCANSHENSSMEGSMEGNFKIQIHKLWS